MTEPRLDPERLAALLDRRLPEREHADAVAQVAASEADQEVLADAAAVLAELEGEDEGPRETGGVTPLRPSGSVSRRLRPGPWGLAAAAVLATLVVGPALLSRRGGPEGDPARLAMLLEKSDSGLPEGWTEQRPWRTTRGGGASLAPDARAVRLGVLLVDLEMAVRARQREPTARLAGQVELLLDDAGGLGAASDSYRAIRDAAGARPDSLRELLETAREGLADLVEADLVPEAPLRLGSWAEAARLAAVRGDREFFTGREARRALERAAEAPFLEQDRTAAVAMAQVRSAAADGAPDLASLRRHLEELLRAAAG
ncbi:MAG TPA: hypothetical protein VFQ76_02105 [Longimicrobiaceae bacterium]|nr:hypothetical protein [Longimicrobiaceae bacterium]